MKYKIDFAKASQATFICLDGKEFRITSCQHLKERRRKLLAIDDDGDEWEYTLADEFVEIRYYRLEEF